MTQARFAAVAGVRRLTQGQYESEVRSPSVKYLAAVGGTGIDLQYTLFGQRATCASADSRGLEKKIFELVEQYAERQPDGRLGYEGRFAMFDYLRGQLLEAGPTALPIQAI